MSIGTLEVFEQQRRNEQMKTNRIDSKSFIELCHANNMKMSQPTLSRKLTDADFVRATGADKEMTGTSKIPAWTFDLKLSTAYAKGGAAPAKTSTALVKSESKAMVPASSPRAQQSKDNNMESIFLLSSKFVYTVADVAKLLSESKQFIMSEIHNGNLFAVKRGKWRIAKTEVERYVKRYESNVI